MASPSLFLKVSNIKISPRYRYIGDIAQDESAIFNDYRLHYFVTSLYTDISGKVVLQRRNAYANMPKVIMGNGGFTVAWLKLKVFQRDGRKLHKHVHSRFLLPSC